MVVPAWAGLVLLEPPSLCRRLFDNEVAGAGLELLLELARPGFEPRSPAAGVYAHSHSSTDERCSVCHGRRNLNHPSLAKSITAPEQRVECKVH